jgi:hypothetical protein
MLDKYTLKMIQSDLQEAENLQAVANLFNELLDELIKEALSVDPD